jgi:hypothetical protein
MKLIELHWDNNAGEGSVRYSKTFNESHFILQLDMLQDCIFDLTNKYEELLTQPTEKANL